MDMDSPVAALNTSPLDIAAAAPVVAPEEKIAIEHIEAEVSEYFAGSI